MLRYLNCPLGQLSKNNPLCKVFDKNRVFSSQKTGLLQEIFYFTKYLTTGFLGKGEFLYFSVKQLPY